MQQIEALKELADKVEAGTEPTAKDLWPVSEHEHPGLQVDWAMKLLPAYSGSLDAAHALHKAVLGDRWIAIVNMNDTTVDMLLAGKAHLESFVLDLEETTPARAWLLAVIRAKISELENA